MPVAIVIAVLLVGFLAMRSRGDDKGPLETVDRDTNCPPVARTDVSATRPGEPVKIDVLANDTDSDGDALVFQIIKATGGEATVDDGGTPTDSIDDRVLFAPDDPAVAESTIEYQALDPQGGFDSSTVTVYVNPEGAALAGATSEAIDTAEGCGAAPDVTTTTSGGPVGPVGPDTQAVDETTTSTAKGTSATTSGRRTSTTKKSTGKTTTTAKKTTTTGGSNTTSPPTVPATTSTTKKPPSSTTTSPINTDCAPYPPQSQQYKDCVTARAKGQPYPPVTTTTAP